MDTSTRNPSNEGMDPFSRLPRECLDLIMDKLSMKESSRAACATRAWSEHLRHRREKTKVLVVPADVSTNGLVGLLESFPHLMEISLKRCAKKAKLHEGDNLSRVIGILAGSSLESLDLSGCTLVGLEIEVMMSLLPNLKRLELSGCMGVNDSLLFQMGRRKDGNDPPHIKSLVLSRCQDITPNGIRAVLQGPGMRDSLEEIDLSHCACDRGTFQLMQCQRLSNLRAVGMRNLTELNLKLTAKHALSDLNFASGSLETCHLEIPNLRSVSFTNNRKLWFLSLRCPKIEVVQLSGCSKLEILGWCENLGHMGRQVRHLNINGCWSLSNGQMEDVFPTLEELETLDMNGCRGITGFKNFSPALTKISMTGCAHITEIETTSSRLQALWASGCNNLAKVEICGSSLAILDLTNCSRLRVLRAGDLGSIPNLHMSGCGSFVQSGG